MIITTEAVMATRPCSGYPRSRVKAIVGDGLDPSKPATLETVLALPRRDARRVLSRLLSPPNAVTWSRGCADRAREYAAFATTTTAADLSDYARHAAADYAAEYATLVAEYATLVANTHSP